MSLIYYFVVVSNSSSLLLFSRVSRFFIRQNLATTTRGWRERVITPYMGLFWWKLFEINFFCSVSYCVVILRTTPHWSVKMTSCNFILLTWEQQYVVLGPRGPWSATFSNRSNICSLNKIRQKRMHPMIYWLFFHMTKFRLSCCWWRRGIQVCWQVGQFVFLEVSTFAAP